MKIICQRDRVKVSLLKRTPGGKKIPTSYLLTDVFYKNFNSGNVCFNEKITEDLVLQFDSNQDFDIFLLVSLDKRFSEMLITSFKVENKPKWSWENAGASIFTDFLRLQNDSNIVVGLSFNGNYVKWKFNLDEDESCLLYTTIENLKYR